MQTNDWQKEVLKQKDAIIEDTQRLLRIKSVLDEEDVSPDAPLGKGVKEALQYMLDLGDRHGFRTKNVGNLAGHLEFGQGEECVGILCHVDVVPEGDGWKSDPFGANIREGKLFARGAIDDKGPTMAAFYAMKIVKELGIPLNKRVRMIIGTDEESEWRCVEHYFKHEEMPTFGFAPDADFPIIHAEKGIADFDLVCQIDDADIHGDFDMIEFKAGRRYNMVPDYAVAHLHMNVDGDAIVDIFQQFLHDYRLVGKHVLNGQQLLLEIEGISAHGMEPDHGKNAGLYLAKFLSSLSLDRYAKKYVDFAANFFFNDSRGRKLGISFADEVTGDLTINVGKLSYQRGSRGVLGLNLRYPVTTEVDKMKQKLEKVVGNQGFQIDNYSDSEPHHVDKNDFLIQVLKKVYEEQTGEKAELLSIGGGTYARSLKSGVAFGPLFPGREDIAHQKDEYIYIDDLIKATAIYAQAIYELAR